MPQLVRAGYLYIAQAPLYRIIRKKKEEYVQDDVALNRKLIELAVNDVTLRMADGSRTFTSEELSTILETLVNLQRYTESVQTQGGSFGDLAYSPRAARGIPRIPRPKSAAGMKKKYATSMMWKP